MAVLPRQTSSGGHWYYPDATPCHQVAKRDGEMRNTNLRDARKLGLLPSVTGILGIIGKESLVSWRIKQALYSSLGLPKTDDETPDYWAKRCIAMSDKAKEDAAVSGSRIHDALEKALTNMPYPDELKVFVEPVAQGFKEKEIEITALEKTMTSVEYGYAGTCDMMFEWKSGKGICDHKTRNTTEGKPFAKYETEPMQLASYYVMAYGEDSIDTAMLVNCLISRTEPGRFEFVRVENPRAAWEAFKACLTLWKYLKKYDPCEVANA